MGCCCREAAVRGLDLRKWVGRLLFIVGTDQTDLGNWLSVWGIDLFIYLFIFSAHLLCFVVN